MITPTINSLLLSIPVAQALLAFTGKADRIGVNDNNICATNGNVALRFHEGLGFLVKEGSYWSHEYVKQRIAVAKAVKGPVSLSTQDVQGLDYPNQKQVEPIKACIYSDQSIGINAEALALLEIVAKACAVGKVIPPPAVLVTATGPLSPLRFTFGNPLQATVTIMPTSLA
jgi:hypothetical protein